jgi:transposase
MKRKQPKPGQPELDQPKQPGRPPKLQLTPEVQARIVQAVSAGSYLDTAASYAGVARSTMYRWLNRGRRDKKGVYAEFAKAVHKAMADAEIRDITQIAKATEASWQASAWRLERKFPDRWGRRDPRGYTSEQFTSFVMRLSEIVKDLLGAEQRQAFAQKLDALLKETERQRVGRNQ